MTEELYFVNISPAQMALKAALDNRQKLFTAILSAIEMDIRTLATYKSYSDDHAGETFYLVFELVKRGNLAMLRHVVERHDLSLRVGEEAVLALAQERVRREKQDEELKKKGVAFSYGESYWHLRKMTPYHADTLLEYAENLVKKITAECDPLRERQRIAEDSNLSLVLAVALANKEILLEQVKACLSYVKEKTLMPTEVIVK